jgi:hypothetical protein
MHISPPSALAAWAVGTAWLLLFLVLERFNAAWGEVLVDWVQVATVLVALCFYPIFRKWFAAWLVKQVKQSR